jgi:hypothetical protein
MKTPDLIKMQLDLLTPAELPDGFRYPPQFERLISLGLIHIEPWHLLEGQELRHAQQTLARLYPERDVVPFAGRQDNDDTACWEDSNVERVVIIHAFASPGWEASGEFATFDDWLREAVEDLIDFGGGLRRAPT